jgi:hypothetical protein
LGQRWGWDWDSLACFGRGAFLSLLLGLQVFQDRGNAGVLPACVPGDEGREGELLVEL